MNQLQTSLPSVRASGFTITPDRLGWLYPSDPAASLDTLQARMRSDGYLYLPGLLNVDEVLAARQSVCEKLAAQGHLDPSEPLMDAVARPGASVKFAPELATRNPIVEQPLYQGPMMNFMERFLGGPVRHFDFTWLRVISPGVGTPSHCDIVYMGRGTQNLFTAWTPMGDVSLDLGGLMILEGSNNNQRLRDTYGKSDVDTFCENRPGQRDAWARGTGGLLSKDPIRIQDQIGGRWLTTEFSAGDVLLFSVFTVHASLDNHTNRIRISTDTRYQLASEAADERWVGDHPVGHGSAGKRGRIC